jgi:hypothetical protein
MAESASDNVSDVIESTSRAGLLILPVETVVVEFTWCAVVKVGSVWTSAGAFAASARPSLICPGVFSSLSLDWEAIGMPREHS